MYKNIKHTIYFMSNILSYLLVVSFPKPIDILTLLFVCV
jgi:hypothetical protein